MKYSSFSGVVAWSQGDILLSQGQAADDDHPLVLERPDLFQGLAPGASLSTTPNPPPIEPASPPVERATAAPGERRTTRVPRGEASGS